MKEQLVVKGVKILALLFEENSATGMNVNEIYRKTGSTDKPLVIDSIKYLEKARLVETDRRTHYKQKKMKLLTDLGRTFVSLMYMVDEYNESYNKLKEAVKKNFHHPKDTGKEILINILRPYGWKKEEVIKYKQLYEESCSLLYYLSPRQNIDALLTRYVSLLSQSGVINNENAKVILNKIITELLSKQLSVIQNDLADRANLQDSKDIKKDEQPFDYVAVEKFGVLDNIFAYGKNLEIRFINKEANAVLLGLLNILKPSKEALDVKFDSIGEAVNIYLKQLQSTHQTTSSNHPDAS